MISSEKYNYFFKRYFFIKNMNKTAVFLILLISVFCQKGFSSEDSSKIFHYYCTVSDKEHFHLLLSLIGSIHQVDFDDLDEIAVFDIGLTQKQKEILRNIEKTKVYKTEEVDPDIFKLFKTTSYGRQVRGWFAWKPVIMKQALDMFPYYLYMDAGCLVLKSPGNLFKHIKQNGYFFIEIPPFSIEERITRPVIGKVISKFSKEKQKFFLSNDTYMIDAGFQGISRKIYNNYILPVYKMAFDLSLFADDGSARIGFGAGRHDQTLFSIFANAENFNFNGNGWSNLKVDEKQVPFHIHWHRSYINEQTCIYRSRGDYNCFGDKTIFIHWRS
jgi:hypothetical protein